MHFPFIVTWRAVGGGDNIPGTDQRHVVDTIMTKNTLLAFGKLTCIPPAKLRVQQLGLSLRLMQAISGTESPSTFEHGLSKYKLRCARWSRRTVTLVGHVSV
jgi:hypothetical protein